MGIEFRTADTSNDVTIIQGGEPSNAGMAPEIQYVDSKDAIGVVASGLAISGDLSQLPENVQGDLGVIKDYISDVIKSKGLNPTKSSYEKVLNDFKFDLDIETDTDMSVAIDRMAGVIKGWRDLAFIKDPKEKRSLLMRLARLPDAKSMNKFIFQEMERKAVWR